MVLTKLYINSPKSIEFAIPEIQHYVLNNNYSGKIITDMYNNIYIHNKKYIPQDFNSNTIFISFDSFQQNNKYLANKIRKYVSNILNSLNITQLICIGGESYIYGLVNNIKYIYHMTNCKSIYDDCQFNNKFYRSYIHNNMVDYNLISNINCNYLTLLINLSNLNKNLLLLINNSNIQTIIIINCNHIDFWKKIKLLYNFKIISRKQFICYTISYFITVTILIRSL